MTGLDAQAEKLGLKKLVGLEDIVGVEFNYNASVVRRRFLKDHRNVLKKLLRLHVIGYDLAKSDPTLTKKVLQKYLGIADSGTLSTIYGECIYGGVYQLAV